MAFIKKKNVILQLILQSSVYWNKNLTLFYLFYERKMDIPWELFVVQI